MYVNTYIQKQEDALPSKNHVLHKLNYCKSTNYLMKSHEQGLITKIYAYKLNF